MSEQEYQDLWHYSERFTRDPLARSELITMAWKEGERLGDRCNVKLMKSAMHFRSKELNKRSAFPCKEVGKSGIDAWSKDLVYIDRPYANSEKTATEQILRTATTPLDHTISAMFIDDLTDDERMVLDALASGYAVKEVSCRNAMPISCINVIRRSLREKAVDHLL
jgi:site-specific DNA-adenine methylase